MNEELRTNSTEGNAHFGNRSVPREYYFQPETNLLIYTWINGLKADQIDRKLLRRGRLQGPRVVKIFSRSVTAGYNST
jgi:hypothetical protein